MKNGGLPGRLLWQPDDTVHKNTCLNLLTLDI